MILPETDQKLSSHWSPIPLLSVPRHPCVVVDNELDPLHVLTHLCRRTAQPVIIVESCGIYTLIILLYNLMSFGQFLNWGSLKRMVDPKQLYYKYCKMV